MSVPVISLRLGAACTSDVAAIISVLNFGVMEKTFVIPYMPVNEDVGLRLMGPAYLPVTRFSALHNNEHGLLGVFRW